VAVWFSGSDIHCVNNKVKLQSPRTVQLLNWCICHKKLLQLCTTCTITFLFVMFYVQIKNFRLAIQATDSVGIPCVLVCVSLFAYCILLACCYVFSIDYLYRSWYFFQRANVKGVASSSMGIVVQKRMKPVSTCFSGSEGCRSCNAVSLAD